jgi:hypothetical protein
MAAATSATGPRIRLVVAIVVGMWFASIADHADPIVMRSHAFDGTMLAAGLTAAAVLALLIPRSRRFLLTVPAGRPKTTNDDGHSPFKPEIPRLFDRRKRKFRREDARHLLWLIPLAMTPSASRVLAKLEAGNGDAGDVAFCGFALLLFVGSVDLMWAELRPNPRAWAPRLRLPLIAVGYAAVLVVGLAVLRPVAEHRISQHEHCIADRGMTACRHQYEGPRYG